MTKRMNDSLLLFVVDEFGELQPNLEAIGSSKEQGEISPKIELNAHQQDVLKDITAQEATILDHQSSSGKFYEGVINSLENELISKAKEIEGYHDEYLTEIRKPIVNANKRDALKDKILKLNFVDFVENLKQLNDGYFNDVYKLNEMENKGVVVWQGNGKVVAFDTAVRSANFILKQYAEKLEVSKKVSFINQNHGIISENLTQGVQNEPTSTNTSLFAEQPQQSSIQNADAVVGGQESQLLRAQSDKQVGSQLSQNDGGVGRIGDSLFSTATSSNGAGNFGGQSSTINAGANDNGDIARSGDRFSTSPANSPTNIKSQIQPSFGGGFKRSGQSTRERLGGLRVSNTSTSDTTANELGQRPRGLGRGIGDESAFASGANARELGGGFKGDDKHEPNGKQDESILQGIRRIAESTDTNERVDFTTQREPNLGSLKEKYKKNVQAITLLKKLESQNRFATSEEQSILSEFSGWGGISMAFDEKNAEWSKEFKELLNLLDEDEYKAARNSTQDAFYTPQIIIDTIYKGLDTLGFNTPEAKNVFEPSAGVGNFLAHAKNHAQNYNFTCTELDSISARILKKLYPNQDIRNHGFEKYDFVKQFDAFIGNPPFGQKKIYDENSNLNNMSVHNYFLAKSIEQVKDDGIVAFVVSKYFMDSKSDSVRELIDEKATFLGAVRLPNNAFSKIANTEVSTDILFFKKGKEPNIDKRWLKSKQYFDDIDEIRMKNGFSEEEAKGFNINEYYKQNPQNILGKMQVVSSRFGFSLECVSDGRDLQKALDNFVSTLPKNVYRYHATKLKDEVVVLNKESSQFNEFKDRLDTLKQGNFFVYEREVYVKISSSHEEIILKKPNLSENDKRRVIKFARIRDEFNKLIELEKSNLSDDEIKPQRDRLNLAYDSFVKTEGFLNKDSNKRAFRDDVEANKILALEKAYDAGVSKQTALKHGVEPVAPSAKKADIFFKRTLMAKKEIKISTPKEALLASVNQYGYLSLSFLEQNLDMKLEDTLKSLLDEKLIFVNHKDNEYILAEKYLSGNVKAKYKEVGELIKQGGNDHLHSNLASLKEILPKDIKAADISVNLGATWVPLKYYKEFFEQAFDMYKESYDLFLNEKTGEWTFRGIDSHLSHYVRSQYSIERRNWNAFRIAEHGLKRKPIKIMDKVEDEYGKEREVLNQKETALAISKLEKLKNDFAEWIYKDYDRRVDLERIYNDKFNTDVEPKYNGDSLFLDGFNKNIILRPHQKNAIIRGIQEQNLLLDHQVGAGKTLVTICAVMEQKRMGLINKPLIVVPNHMLGEWQDKFYEAYPNANILVPNEQDFKKDRREQFYSRIATNEHDAIIMTHSQFKKIPSPFNNKIKIQEQMLEALEHSLNLAQANDNAGKMSVKDLETRIDKLKVKIQNSLNEKIKSKAIDFGELGIDCLAVDEAHEFKNLMFTTAMGQVNGIGTGKGSQRAFDLYTKTDYIHENDFKLYFLTGTPISNSITEIYTMQRYLQPQILEEKGIDSFDSWASTFGEIANAWELDSSGINYKITARFNKFKNVPELSNMYKGVADIITNADIEKYEKDFVPKLYNGKPINEVMPRSDKVAKFIGIQDEFGRWNEGSIVWRMEHQSDDIRRNNLLACTTDARKAGLDYRVIDPNADDFENSKINELVKNVHNEYLAWNEDKGTQLIFCDLSTPKKHSQEIIIDAVAENSSEIQTQSDEMTEFSENLAENELDVDDFDNINDSLDDNEKDEIIKSNDELIAQNVKFDVYSDIFKKLVAKGIPKNEICFIHDAKSDLQKKQLMADMKAGKKRILLGSTQKMGAGMNVQDRVVAIHHLDCPWRPSDLEQRNGRVIRQGNLLFKRDTQNFKIKEYRYATQRTYDARMWQTIENKARSIEQFRRGGANVRTVDDITGTAADAAEMKAEATGNPFILMQVQLQSDLRQEELLYSNHQREIFHNEETLQKLKAKSKYLSDETRKFGIFKDILDKNKIQNFKGKFFTHSEGEQKATEFSILKDNNSEANKATQELVKKAFERNVSLLVDGGKDELDLFEYRGLIVSGERTSRDTLSFYVSTADKKEFLAPENLVYTAKEYEIFNLQSLVSFTGFVQRLNNFCADMDKNIEKNKQDIERLNKDAKELESITGENAKEYSRKEYLEALREDNRLIIDEIEKTARNRGYKSNFEPKSAKILQMLNTRNTNDNEISK